MPAQAKIKVFIPFRRFATGGPVSFYDNFTKYLNPELFQITSSPKKPYDVLFIISSCPLSYVIDAKRNNRPIIQRLDGVYHPAIPGLNGYIYRWKNLLSQIIHNYFAEQIIYQSQFSERSCQSLLGSPHGKTSLIYNGVPIPATIDSKLAEGKQVTRLVTFASWRRSDQIIPIINAFKLLPEEFALDVIGPQTKEISKLLQKYRGLARLTIRGRVTHDELKKMLPLFDLFLFSDQSACPHSVLEAMSYGLPIIAFSRGAIPELIINNVNGYIVPLRQHNPFRDQYNFMECDSESFADAIIAAQRSLPKLKNSTSKTAKERFDIKNSVQEYERIITASLQGKES